MIDFRRIYELKGLKPKNKGQKTFMNVGIRRKNISNVLLMCVYFQVIVMLCIFDSLFAGFSLIEYGLKKGFKLILWTTPIYVDIWPRLIYPFHNIANTLSVFVTVAIAIER